MLLDKGYYDYDYDKAKGEFVSIRRNETQEEKDKRTQRMMDRFGFGKVKKVAPKTLTADELQSEVLSELKV